MREENFRNKISWMMFLFSLFVIWVHAYNIELFSAGQAGALWETADRIETIVSVAVGQTAVPGFFLLSSYLFFRTYRPEKLLKKWKERVHSVLIHRLEFHLLLWLRGGFQTSVHPCHRREATGSPGAFGISGRRPSLQLRAGILVSVPAYHPDYPVAGHLSAGKK